MRFLVFLALLATVGCQGTEDVPDVGELGIQGLVEVWPDMMDFSGLGDSASAACIVLAELAEDSVVWNPNPSPSILTELGGLGLPIVPHEECRTERNQVWYGDSGMNAYGITLGPMYSFLPDSLHVWVSYFVDGTNGAEYRCGFLGREEDWHFQSCIRVSVS